MASWLLFLKLKIENRGKLKKLLFSKSSGIWIIVRYRGRLGKQQQTATKKWQ